MARKKAGAAPVSEVAPVLDFMRGFYDLPERRLEAIFQDARRPAHERLAAIAAYLYRQPDDTGVRLFYPALEGIEGIACAMRRQPSHDETAPGGAQRAAAKPKAARMARAA